jgi:hypothetical protein
MPAHDFKHERSLVGSGRGTDAINSFAYSVQRGWGTNRQVGHGHVVIDGPDESHNLEVPMFGGLSFRDLTCRNIRRTPKKSCCISGSPNLRFLVP